jgi:hypothetical protein
VQAEEEEEREKELMDPKGTRPAIPENHKMSAKQ